MSVILAYKKGKTIYMGCDSQSTSGEMRNYGEGLEQIKIHVYKDYLLGSVGSAAAGRAVANSLSVLDQLERFDKTSLVKVFIPAIYKLLLDSKEAKLKDDGIKFDNQFILARGDKAYIIDSTGVYPMNKYVAIGSGTPFVYPHLINYNIKNDVNDMIIRAIRDCSKNHIYVSGAIKLIDTKDLQYKEVE